MRMRNNLPEDTWQYMFCTHLFRYDLIMYRARMRLADLGLAQSRQSSSFIRITHREPNASYTSFILLHIRPRSLAEEL